MAQTVGLQGETASTLTTWSLTSSYRAGETVVYGSSLYKANSDIPANTAWAIGTSGATWSLVVLSSQTATITKITNTGLRTGGFLTSDGKVYTFNNNSYTQVPGTGRATKNDMNNNSPGITNAGEVVFYDQYAKVSVQPGAKAIDFGFNGGHALVLFDNGELWGWGRNDYGQLAISNAQVYYLMPRRLNTGVQKVFYHNTNLCRATASYYVRTVIQKNNKIYACGYNGLGALGLNDTTDRTTWTELTWAIGASGNAPRSVWNLGNYVGGILIETDEGSGLSKYKMAGYNNNGHMGTTLGTFQSPTDITSIYAGGATTTYRIRDAQGGFGYTDSADNNYSGMLLWLQDSTDTTRSKVMTAGANNWGSIGNSANTGNNTTPFNALSGASYLNSSTYNVKQVSWSGSAPGTVHVLLTNGDLWAWGYNSHGQVGDGTSTQVNSPIKVNTNVKELLFPNQTAWYYEYRTTTCIRKNDGTYWSCGLGGYGQCANGVLADTNTGWQRMRIPKTRDWVVLGWYSMHGNSEHGFIPLMYDTEGVLWSWGRNDWYSITNRQGVDGLPFPTPVNPPFL